MPTMESQGAFCAVIASESASRQGIHGSGGHRAAAAPAMQREIGDAEIGSDERLLRLRRADETDRESEDRCRARRALAQPPDKAVERGRRVADRDDRAGEIVAPEGRKSTRLHSSP